MLELKKVTKKYYIGNPKHDNCVVVDALKGIDLSFRTNEFVAILGPSGCGKTTLLNIIGGLDQYSAGDLIIDSRTTKEYSDHDWDNYRNHSVGFVFQTYNLISHQTVLGNVELALTLTGMDKTQRRKKAMKALAEVGLSDQVNKRPNQLSGGQMQRVAIARAIVNDPHIILADEPTGALDTETSVQIMDILKEISRNRLVIMVTHNPELANQYSSRIIRLKDGRVVSDTNPKVFSGKAVSAEKNRRLPSMSFFTALSLSFNNLLQKKARTLMTAFAGSIGIIGIALILSLSSGFALYVEKMEKDTLSTYPLTIYGTTEDYSTMLERLDPRFANKDEPIYHELDKIYTKEVLRMLIVQQNAKVIVNDLRALKVFIEEHPEFKDLTTSIKYTYNARLQIYQEQAGEIVRLYPFSIGNDESNPLPTGNIWSELIDNPKLLSEQYDVLSGSWPNQVNEVVLVIDQKNEINDFVMYALGLKPYSEISHIVRNIYDPTYEYESPDVVYEYDDVIGMSYNLLLVSQYYSLNQETGLWENRSKNSQYMRNLIENESLNLKISGVVRLKNGISNGAISSTVGYTKELTHYIVNGNVNSSVLKAQLASPEENVFTGQPFSEKSDYTNLLNSLGYSDLTYPYSISFYPSSFEGKERIIALLNEFNQTRDENDQIFYNDYIAIMMKSIAKIINSITYVLIAFVAISLIVSSIMIGIITYISVLERTKEIGVLRSIGASKKDITRVFNAETLIIGAVAGILGVLIAVLLDYPINIIIDKLANIGNVAKVPIWGALILILISTMLTLIAGLIPSRYASKKDPVVALRSE